MLSVSHQMTWVEKLDDWAKKVSEDNGKLQHIPLDEIVRNFQLAIWHSDKKYTSRDIANKIHLLSNYQLRYYESARFGWIKRLFSAFCNGMLLCAFKSDAQLGLELTHLVLSNSPVETQKPIPVPVVIEKPHVDQPFQNNSVNIPTTVEQIFLCVNEEPKEEKEPLSLRLPIPLPVADEPVLPVEIPVVEEIVEIPEELEPAEAMRRTIYSFWKEATTLERQDMLDMWNLMMQGTRIRKWEKLSHHSHGARYLAEFDYEASGLTPPDRVTLVKQKIKIDFSEINNQKVVSFPEPINGIVCKVPVGRSIFRTTFEIPLRSIHIHARPRSEGSTDPEITDFTAEADMGETIATVLRLLNRKPTQSFTAQQGKDFWRKVVWNPPPA